MASNRGTLLLLQLSSLREGRASAQAWRIARSAVPNAVPSIPHMLPAALSHGGSASVHSQDRRRPAHALCAGAVACSNPGSLVAPLRRGDALRLLGTRTMAIAWGGGGGSGGGAMARRGDGVEEDGERWEIHLERFSDDDGFKPWEEVEWIINGRLNSLLTNGHLSVDVLEVGSRVSGRNRFERCNLGRLSRVVAETHAKMGRDQVALALDRLRRLLREQQNVDEHGMADIVRTGQLLLDRAKSVATGMSPKQLTMVLSCLAHLHGRGAKNTRVLFKVIGGRVSSSAHGFDANTLLLFLRILSQQSCVEMRRTQNWPPEVWDALLRRSVEVLPSCNGRDLMNLLRVLTKLGLRPSVDDLADFAVRAAAVRDASPVFEGLSIAQSLGRLGWEGGEVWKWVAGKASEMGVKDMPFALTACVEANGAAQVAYQAIIHELAERCHVLDGSNEMEARDIALVFWAMARIGQGGGTGVIDALCHRAFEVEWTDAWEISLALWGIARTGAGRRRQELVELLEAAALENTPNMGPRSVSLTLWAFTDLPTPRQDVIRALCEAGAREAGGMCGQGIANSLRALVAFNVDPREPTVQLFIDALCRRCVKTLPHSGRNRVVATVRALAQLSVRPSEELQGAIADAVLRSADSMDEAAAVAVLRALHGIGLGSHAAAWELRGRLDFQGVVEKM